MCYSSPLSFICSVSIKPYPSSSCLTNVFLESWNYVCIGLCFAFPQHDLILILLHIANVEMYFHLLHIEEKIMKSIFWLLQFLIFTPCLQSYQVMNRFLAKSQCLKPNHRALRCTSHKRSLPKTGDLSWIGSVPSNEITRPNLHKFSRKKTKCRQRIFSRIFLPRLGTYTRWVKSPRLSPQWKGR